MVGATRRERERERESLIFPFISVCNGWWKINDSDLMVEMGMRSFKG